MAELHRPADQGAFEPFSCGTGDFRGATPLWLAAFAANQSANEGSAATTDRSSATRPKAW